MHADRARVSDARIYNEVHYRTFVVRATVLGRQVEQWVARDHFLPLDSPHVR
jgi:hypothetical protein